MPTVLPPASNRPRTKSNCEVWRTSSGLQVSSTPIGAAAVKWNWSCAVAMCAPPSASPAAMPSAMSAKVISAPPWTMPM